MTKEEIYTAMKSKVQTFDWDELHNREGYLQVHRDGSVVIMVFKDFNSGKIYVLNEIYEPCIR